GKPSAPEGWGKFGSTRPLFESPNPTRLVGAPDVVAATYAMTSPAGEGALSPTASLSRVRICRKRPSGTDAAVRAGHDPAAAENVTSRPSRDQARPPTMSTSTSLLGAPPSRF